MTVRRIALPESLTAASLDALASALDDASSDADASAWSLAGSESAFCRGMDLSAMVGADASDALGRFAKCVARLRRAPRPTIAIVHGDALGGGVGLAAACDVVLAAPSTTFALPEALFGLLPGVILPVLLERMTPQKARLFALRGRAHDAEWARASGLVDEIVPAADLDRAAARHARELGRAAKPRVLGLRSWIFEIAELEADGALTRGAAVTASLVKEPEVQEAVRRFVEDGTPPWMAQ
jgi:enoyl-CoA hydratase/carnithine racemase